MAENKVLSLKGHQGSSSAEFSEKIDLKRIHDFCRAVGVEETEYAPPTFLTLFRRGEFDLLTRIGVDLSQVLHAEQEYEYENILQAEDEVYFKTTLDDVIEKQSAEIMLSFMTFKTEIHRRDGSHPHHEGVDRTVLSSSSLQNRFLHRQSIGTATSVIVFREKRSK